MTNEGSKYKAKDGCFIVRKYDGFIMGENIDLGTSDDISNYEEQPYTEESYEAFYKSIGMESPKSRERQG